jgi:nucleotide-binding universal stress UspA family protein
MSGTRSLLVALNDSLSSRAVMDYLIELTPCPREWEVTLVHLFRKPQASEELMGRKFTAEQPRRFAKLLDEARDRLVRAGYDGDRVRTRLVEEPYPTIAEGIIDQFRNGSYDLVVIGRKKMTKAEEFVRGDVSVKLIRAITDAGVLVVTSG